MNEQFTITPDYLTSAILFIKKLFHAMITRVSQQQQNQAAPKPNTTQAPAQTSQGSMPPLNATNLQQLQQQQEALQRARRASSQSAAVPAAPFGAPSPQGVPHAYGPGGLAPERLKLPPPKKRKQSHTGAATASPVREASAAPAAATKYKQAVAEAKSTAAGLAGAFKCAVAECQYHYQGFSRQADLDKHVEESHQPEENIDDPLQYALDSFAIGLETKSGAEAKQGAAAGASVKPTATASPAKQGISTPATTGTPTTRAAAQLKPTSPAVSTQHLTSRQPSGKTVGPKASLGKDDQKEPGKTLEDADVKDDWANCPMSLESLHDTFSNFQSKTLPSLGYDAFEEFLNADMFSSNQAEDTPDSWDLALATLTPDAEPKEPMIVDEFEAAWDDATAEVTAAWMDIPLEIQNNDGDGIKGVRIDWDLLENQKKEMSLDGGGISIPAL